MAADHNTAQKRDLALAGGQYTGQSPPASHSTFQRPSNFYSCRPHLDFRTSSHKRAVNCPYTYPSSTTIIFIHQYLKGPLYDWLAPSDIGHYLRSPINIFSHLRRASSIAGFQSSRRFTEQSLSSSRLSSAIYLSLDHRHCIVLIIFQSLWTDGPFKTSKMMYR